MNKLCCLIDPYKTCKWCGARQCRECLTKPQESIHCPRSANSRSMNGMHYWVGGSILRSMPLGPIKRL